MRGVKLDSEYYTLPEASDIIKCSTDDIVRFGADGKLPIHVLLGAWSLYSLKRLGCQPLGSEWTPFDLLPLSSPLSIGKKMMQLHPSCLFAYFSGDKAAEVVLQPAELENDAMATEIIFELRRRRYLYPTNADLSACIDRGVDPSGLIPDPVRLTECVMVVGADDLKRFTEDLISGNDDLILLVDQKACDKKKVQDFGQKLLKKYTGHQVQMNCTQAKKLPQLKQFYKDYPGKDPVLVDQWLQEAGMPAGKRGRQSAAEKKFNPSLD